MKTILASSLCGLCAYFSGSLAHAGRRASLATPELLKASFAQAPQAAQPMQSPRTLLGHKSFVVGQRRMKLEVWRWTDARDLAAGEQLRGQGRALVHRRYAPRRGGGTTVTQTLLVAPEGVSLSGKPSQLELAKIALSQVAVMAQSDHLTGADPVTLLDAAMKGMMSALDKYSVYHPPRNVSSLHAALEGLVGIGVQLSEPSAGAVRIDKVFAGPARRAGVRKGDQLVGVDGAAINSVGQAMQALRGEAGTGTVLTIKRGDRQLQMAATRQPVNLAPLRQRLLPAGVGYLRLPRFNVGVARAVDDAVTRLAARNGGALRGLVIDLRGNSGGLLDEAVDLLRAFVRPEATLVKLRGRDDRSLSVYESDVVAEARDFSARLQREHQEPLFSAVLTAQAHVASRPRRYDLPLVVLVDKESASASETVAGALQALGRATILGDTTWGKGSAQMGRPLANGGELRLTFGRFYFANGRTPDGVGVTPDVPRATALQGIVRRRGADALLAAAQRMLSAPH